MKSEINKKMNIVYKNIISLISNILDLNKKDWGYDVISNYSDIQGTDLCPAAMLKPGEYKKINKPFILINDGHPMMSSIGNEIEMVGILAHEVRHVWQYFQNNPVWNEEMLNNGRKIGFDEKTTLNNVPENYINQDIELDAYSFQLAFVRILYDSPGLKFEPSVMNKFPSDFESRINTLYYKYKNRVKNYIKRLY